MAARRRAKKRRAAEAEADETQAEDVSLLVTVLKSMGEEKVMSVRSVEGDW